MKKILFLMLFALAGCATDGGHDYRPYRDPGYRDQDRDSGYHDHHRDSGYREQRGAPEIRITRATYGDHRACDATQAVSEYCNGKRSCNFEVSNRMCGDPEPGRHKGVTVEFACHGSGGMRHASAPEGRTAYLNCD
jgi:hypothetical protein